MEFTHFDGKGNAVMVDVGDKAITSRGGDGSGGDRGLAGML